MLEEHWYELKAQVEDHGPEAVEFRLGNSAENEDDFLEIDITDIKFEDSLVKVVLE